MDQGVKRTQRDYSLTFKLAVVNQIEKGELTYKQAQAQYGSRAGLRFWYGCASMVGKIGVRGLRFDPAGAKS